MLISPVDKEHRLFSLHFVKDTLKESNTLEFMPRVWCSGSNEPQLLCRRHREGQPVPQTVQLAGRRAGAPGGPAQSLLPVASRTQGAISPPPEFILCAERARQDSWGEDGVREVCKTWRRADTGRAPGPPVPSVCTVSTGLRRKVAPGVHGNCKDREVQMTQTCRCLQKGTDLSL